MSKPFQEKVSCMYGAPMGRPSDPVSKFQGVRVRLQRVPFIDGDYDQGGAYWGGWRCEPLWCAWGETEDEQIVTYLRAPNREAAKAKIPGALFYR